MHPITANITALHRRLLWRERAVAACWTLSVVLAAACGLGLADYWMQFSDRGLRVMITAALAATVAWALHRWWLVPQRRRERPLAVARRVEARFPQLQDRLASALEFLGQAEDDATAGSATLRRAVVSQAELELAELSLDTIIDRRPLRRAATWAGIAAAVVAACLLLDAAAVHTSLVRLVAPWGDTEWPRVNHLAFRDPPTRLAVGQPFEVELVDRGGSLPDDVRIEYRFERDGRREVQTEWMNRAGDVMVARRENVREPFEFRAAGGDDETMRWTTVEVVEPPQLESLAITAHPPAYTGLPAVAAQPHLEVLAGTGIEISGTATEPLGAARIVIGTTTIDATIRADSFSTASNQWTATESGSYRIELESRDGVAGTAGQWSLRVEPDTPPTVAWQEPRDDLFVLPMATVPIAAVAKDNLAVARVELQYRRSDHSDANPATIELFRGPETAAAANGESRDVDYLWPLAPLELPVGSQLTLSIQADDYRPNTGKTLTLRRITIITREELDVRLADEQSQLSRRLDETLVIERSTRRDVRGLEIQLRDAGQLAANDRDTLQAAELNQRRVGRLLVDPADSVSALAAALSAELRMNGIDDADLERQMDNVQQQLGILADGPLAAADQSLTAAQKSAESDHAGLPEALTAAGRNQDEVVAVLEQLLEELSGWANYGRIVRDLARLREDQLAHHQATRDSIGLDTLPLELRELSRQQRATINKAAAAQDVLTRRFERIEQGMDAPAAGVTEQDADAAARLADAVEVARELAIAGNMQQATRDLEGNRVGQALARETQIAEALQQVLDVLRDRVESRPEQLVEKLRAAERDLAALRAELAKLRAEIAEMEQRPQTERSAQQLSKLRDRQQQMRNRTARLARELDRLQAAEAGRSTQQAGEKLADSPPNEPRPANSEQVERAEQDLAKAAEQLAQRRRQAEEDWARAFLERFKVELAAMVKDQQQVIETTKALDTASERRTESQLDTIAELAEKERQLADDAHVHSELLAGLRVIGVALADAQQQLTAAAEKLEDQVTGEPALQAEQRALARFEQIVAALAETAAAANNPPPPAGQGNPAAGEQSQRPLFDLFEVKLLRTLQADLNERTQAFQQRQSAAVPPGDDQAAAVQREAQELAVEQGRLAELVQELLSRENEEEDGDE